MRNAWIMVVDSQTLMSSWVEKRDTSDRDRRTAKMGTVSYTHLTLPTIYSV